MSERVQTGPDSKAPREDFPLFFEEVSASYVDSTRFVERAWLLAEVERHLADPDCRFVLLTAEPGAGLTG